MGLLHTVLETLFPNLCFGCDRPIPHVSPPVCDNCLLELPPLEEPQCLRCSLPLVSSPLDPVPHLCCPDCTHAPPPWRQARAIYHYGGPIAKAWRQVKYQKKSGLIREVGLTSASAARRQLQRWQAEHFPHDPPCLLPVPMHPRALAARGFNQSMLLASIWSQNLHQHHLSHHLLTHGIAKRKHTPQQAGFDAAGRHQNLRGAFAICPATREHLDHRPVVLIDDVMTTGATARELASLLPPTCQVFVLTLARAYTLGS